MQLRRILAQLGHLNIMCAVPAAGQPEVSLAEGSHIFQDGKNFFGCHVQGRPNKKEFSFMSTFTGQGIPNGFAFRRVLSAPGRRKTGRHIPLPDES